MPQHILAVPGQAIVYHTGPSLKGAQAASLDKVRRLYDAGSVDLVQRRVDDGFDYIAIFRRVPARVAETFASAGL